MGGEQKDSSKASGKSKSKKKKSDKSKSKSSKKSRKGNAKAKTGSQKSSKSAVNSDPVLPKRVPGGKKSKVASSSVPASLAEIPPATASKVGNLMKTKSGKLTAKENKKQRSGKKKKEGKSGKSSKKKRRKRDDIVPLKHSGTDSSQVSSTLPPLPIKHVTESQARKVSRPKSADKGSAKSAVRKSIPSVTSSKQSVQKEAKIAKHVPKTAEKVASKTGSKKSKSGKLKGKKSKKRKKGKKGADSKSEESKTESKSAPSKPARTKKKKKSKASKSSKSDVVSSSKSEPGPSATAPAPVVKVTKPDGKEATAKEKTQNEKRKSRKKKRSKSKSKSSEVSLSLKSEPKEKAKVAKRAKIVDKKPKAVTEKEAPISEKQVQEKPVIAAKAKPEKKKKPKPDTTINSRDFTRLSAVKTGKDTTKRLSNKEVRKASDDVSESKSGLEIVQEDPTKQTISDEKLNELQKEIGTKKVESKPAGSPPVKKESVVPPPDKSFADPVSQGSISQGSVSEKSVSVGLRDVKQYDEMVAALEKSPAIADDPDRYAALSRLKNAVSGNQDLQFKELGETLDTLLFDTWVTRSLTDLTLENLIERSIITKQDKESIIYQLRHRFTSSDLVQFDHLATAINHYVVRGNGEARIRLKNKNPNDPPDPEPANPESKVSRSATPSISPKFQLATPMSPARPPPRHKK